MDIVSTTREHATINLTRTELVALANALNEVVNGPDAIESWEFVVRMGIERSEAEGLRVQVSSLLASFRDVAPDE